jgi:hypothetical protein
MTYEQHFNKLLDELSPLVRNLNVKVIMQPSLNDLTQEPVYPVTPFQPTAQFLKQNNVKISTQLLKKTKKLSFFQVILLYK